MKRLLPAAVLLCACTLIVDHELDSHPPPGPPDAGPCVGDEVIFLDGTPNDGGAFFHSGVTQARWHGPAFPREGFDPSGHGAVLAFLHDGGLDFVAGGNEQPLQVYLRALEGFTPTVAVPAGGHNGTNNYGCGEVLLAQYDPIDDRTSWSLYSNGCGPDQSWDGGVSTGAPDSQGPALGWAPYADGGGAVAAMYGGFAETCDEVFPLSCIPPGATALPASGPRDVEGLVGANEQPVWVVTSGAATTLYSASFTQLGQVVPWAGSVTAIALDVAVAARINGGAVEAVMFDATGATRATTTIDLGDSGAHALAIAHFGTKGTQIAASWLAGDGTARWGTLDVSQPSAMKLTGVHPICGSAGASFAAPLSAAHAVVQVGEGLSARLMQ